MPVAWTYPPTPGGEELAELGLGVLPPHRVGLDHVPVGVDDLEAVRLVGHGESPSLGVPQPFSLGARSASAAGSEGATSGGRCDG